MSKYAVLFRFSAQAAQRFVAKPSDRAAAVRELAESVGGRLESCYWMLGPYDGLTILELPGPQTAVALQPDAHRLRGRSPPMRRTR